MKTTELPKPPRRANRGIWTVPSSCPGCDKEGSLTEKAVETEQLIREEDIRCDVLQWVCSDCGAQFMSPEQATNGVKRAVEAYQKKHRLLTAGEIREGRKAAGLSAVELAEKAEIGEATIKRLEAGVTVQQASTNKLLKAALETRKEAADYKIDIVFHSFVHCVKVEQSFWAENAHWNADRPWKDKSNHYDSADFWKNEDSAAYG